jgi:hypothetical protein
MKKEDGTVNFITKIFICLLRYVFWDVQACADMVKAYNMLFGRRKTTAYLLLRESDNFDFIKEIDVTL